MPKKSAEKTKLGGDTQFRKVDCPKPAKSGTEAVKANSAAYDEKYPRIELPTIRTSVGPNVGADS